MNDSAQAFSSSFVMSAAPISIIMAAGHGARLKSQRSKMLHKIWGVPTVVRVCAAASAGLSSSDQVVMIGMNAGDVMSCVGRAEGRRFVPQGELKGTGHAVKMAVKELEEHELERDIYVFPADKGLLDHETVSAFMERFDRSRSEMMVMVSAFSGSIQDNSHGRVVRAPERDANGKETPEEDAGKVVCVVEHKDILAMEPGQPYRVTYRGREYDFSREELLNEREFNAGVYAFRGKLLKQHLDRLTCDNVQGEMYLTELISIFNDARLSVEAAPAPREEVVLGFNDKAALRRMENIARHNVFEELKRLITIADPDDFFIANEVKDQILEMDRQGISPDLYIGEGAILGPGVKVGPEAHIEKNARLLGNIHLGRGVFIGESTYLDTYSHQTMRIGDHTEILQRNMIKGRVTIGKQCCIETTVRLTGSDERPMIVGDGAHIKGSTYMYGCVLEDGAFVQNCYLRQKRIRRRTDAAGNVVKVCHIFPPPEGAECVEQLTTLDVMDGQDFKKDCSL